MLLLSQILPECQAMYLVADRIHFEYKQDV